MDKPLPGKRHRRTALLLVLTLAFGTLLLNGCGGSGNDAATTTTEPVSSGQNQGEAATTVRSSEEDLEEPMSVEAPDISGEWEVELIDYESPSINPGIGPGPLEEGNPVFYLYLREPEPDDESSDLLFLAKVHYDNGATAVGTGNVDYGEDERGDTVEGGRITMDISGNSGNYAPLEFIEVNLDGNVMTGELTAETVFPTEFRAQRVNTDESVADSDIEGQWEGTWYYDGGNPEFDLDIGFTTEDNESLGLLLDGYGTYSAEDFMEELDLEGVIRSDGSFTADYNEDGTLSMSGLVAGDYIQGTMENTTPEGFPTSDPFSLRRVSRTPETTSE